MEQQYLTMCCIVCWIIFLELTPSLLSTFASRKLCHAGCGLGIMLLDSTHAHSRLFVWAVAASSIAMTWNLSPLPPFRFSRPKDVGITAYLLLVSVWFALQMSSSILAPLFFADPAGAVVGKACSKAFGPRRNPTWYGEKTLAGTAAVFAFTYATIAFRCTTMARLAIAAIAAVAEGIGGDFDNLAIAAVVLLGWWVCT